MRTLVCCLILALPTMVLAQCPEGKCPPTQGKPELSTPSMPFPFGEAVYSQARGNCEDFLKSTQELASSVAQKGFRLHEAGIHKKKIAKLEGQFIEVGTRMRTGHYFLNQARMRASVATHDDEFLDATKDVLRARRTFEDSNCMLQEIDLKLSKLVKDLPDEEEPKE